MFEHVEPYPGDPRSAAVEEKSTKKSSNIPRVRMCMFHAP